MNKYIGHRDAIIEALNKTLEIFTSHSEKKFDEVISCGLQLVADATGLNRIAVYRLLDKTSGDIGQIYVWAYGKNVPLDKELVILPKIPPIIRWLDTLTKGKIIHENVNDMPKDQANFCAQFGIKSILFVPIFTHGNFWGIVTLEDHTNYRYFNEDSLGLLRSTALLCANAFIRNEITENAENAMEALRYREALTSALNKAAIMFLSQAGDSFEEAMTAGVREIVDIVNVDRMSVWRNTKKSDGMHMSQIYRWYRQSGGTTVVAPEFKDTTYKKLVPRWEDILSNHETINGPINTLPEAEFLKTFNIVSLFVTPVFIDNDFWGFVLYEDHEKERVFDNETVEMLRSAAFLCVSTVLRAEMEHAIADANEFNQTVITDLPIGFTVFDDKVVLKNCNDKILQSLNTTKEYYLSHFEEFSPEYQSNGVNSIDAIIDVHKRALNGEKFTFSWEHKSFTGEIIPFEVTLTRVNYKNSYMVLAYQYDLSNIKKLERDILEAEELTHAVTESSPFPYILFDENFIPLDCNNAAMQLLSAPYKQFLLDNYWETFVPDTQPDGHSSYEKALATNRGADKNKQNKYEWMQKSFDGELIPVENTVTYIRHKDKNLCVTYKYDLRDSRKMLENIRRGSDLLKEALDKATLASKAKGEFLSNMSHEMRTPLNAIIGMTAIAKNANDIERKNYALNKIEDASAHLLGVINDVLDMSKIEANKLELSDVEFNFEKMLQKTIAVINFRVEEKKQKLTVNIDKDIPEYLIADDQRLNQIITNLLSNAVKFTPDHGFIKLDAQLMEENDKTCVLKISVEDSGIGISDEQKDRLFRSFQQAETSTVRKYGGTGLGLAICKNITEMMGGKIWIESEIGKGSKFVFTIKAKRGSNQSKTFHKLSVNWENVRILAVDDDPDTLNFFADFSKRFNLHCDTASNGEDALKLIENKGDYNIYFIDWKMPGIDGITLSKKINNIRSRQNDSLVIMISAVEWAEIEKEARKAGVKKFLSKPLFPSVIADIIYDSLETDWKNNTADDELSTNTFLENRILLAEDIEINREIVMSALEPTGIGIDCAENGVQAVRMFRENPDRYDLIFMDIQMPEMDGYEAAQKIRELELEFSREVSSPSDNRHLRKQIPIIAMTANVFKEDIQKCIDAGMNDHLGKPLDLEAVVEKLKKFL